MKSQRKYAYYILAILIPVVASWFLAQGCLKSDAAGEFCLGWATPYVHQLLRPVANALGHYPKDLYAREISWGYGAVILISLISFVRRKHIWGVFWLLAALPIVGEGYALASQKELATICHLAALGLLGLFWFLSKKNDDYTDTSAPLRWWELGVFAILMAGMLFMRFYALNRIPWNWDTELCIFRQIASSWDRIWQHESGFAPQTSTGLSWLLINKALGHFDEPETYHLIHRTLGCFLSALKVTLLFLFLRTYFGKFPAFFGAVLLAFGPPEDWWARVPNFHHWPGIMALLVIWGSINAAQQRSWQSFLLLSVLSGLTRFVYPSGMFMGFVPIAFFGSLLLFRWGTWRPHFAKICILLLGVIFWVEWLSLARAAYMGRWEFLPPIIIPSHSEMPGGMFAKLQHIFLENGAELISAIFYKQVNSTHWTFALTPNPWRSVPSVVAILGLLSLARMIGQRRDNITWLLTISLFFCALPGITSAVADRRIGAIFIVLIIMAAREAGWVCNAMQRTLGRRIVTTLQVIVPIVLAGYLAALGGASFFFSSPGIPRQVALGKVFRQNVKDNYILVDLTGQLACDLFYSVYREMKSRECRAGFATGQYEGAFTADGLIENPRVDTASWWYPRTEFALCTDWGTRRWAGATFMITESSNAARWLSRLKERFPQGEVETVDVSYMEYQKEPLIIFRTPL